MIDASQFDKFLSGGSCTEKLFFSAQEKSSGEKAPAVSRALLKAMAINLIQAEKNQTWFLNDEGEAEEVFPDEVEQLEALWLAAEVWLAAELH